MLIRTARRWLQDWVSPPDPVTYGDPANAETVILVYNTMWGHLPLLNEGEVPPRCLITTERAYWSRARAVVFHLPTLGRLPLKKPEGQLWVAWSKECPENYPQHKDPAFRSKFDLFMTYQRDADVISPYYSEFGSRWFRRDPAPKSDLICSFISSSNNRSERVEFLRELMNYLPVHCYGSLFQNRKLEFDRGLDSRLELYSRYQFTLGLENALSRDYVTEKLFEPLQAGSLPVYRGAPNVSQFEPGANCFINAADFPNVKALADYLSMLAQDQESYQQFLLWKSRPFHPSFRKMLDESRGTPWLRLCRLLQSLSPLQATVTEVPRRTSWRVESSWVKAHSHAAVKRLPALLTGGPEAWPYSWSPEPKIPLAEDLATNQVVPTSRLWRLLEPARLIRAHLRECRHSPQHPDSLPGLLRRVYSDISVSSPTATPPPLDPADFACSGPAWFQSLLLFDGFHRRIQAGSPVLVGISENTDAAHLQDLSIRGQKWWAWCVDGWPTESVLEQLHSAADIFAADLSLVDSLSKALARPVRHLPPAVQPRLHHPGRRQPKFASPEPWNSMAEDASASRISGCWEGDRIHLARSFELRREHSMAARLQQAGLTERTDQPETSVICSSRRPHKFAHILASYKQQRYQAKELILVIHVPESDAVREMEQLLEQQEIEATLVHAHPSWSLGRCLQSGAEQARGDYIARFDDDDYYGPNYLSHMVAYLEDSQAGMVGKNSFPIHFTQSERSLHYKPGQEHRFTLLESGASFVYRRQLHQLGVNWPDCSRAEDMEFSSRCWIRAIPQRAVDRFDFVCRRGGHLGHTWDATESQLFSRFQELSPSIRPGATDY